MYNRQRALLGTSNVVGNLSDNFLDFLHAFKRPPPTPTRVDGIVLLIKTIIRCKIHADTSGK